MMKNSKLSRKKRKKDRTWAEAATLALQMSSNKIFGIRQILETIYHKNLKEISLDKPAENVLTTMLNHHAQLPNCPFFRVKGRNGLYALKSNWLKKQGEVVPTELYEHEQADMDSIETTLHSSTDEMLSPEQQTNRENHTYSIQGKSLQAGSTKKYMFQRSLYRKKNSLLRPSSIHNRRHSSPMKLAFRSRSPLTPRRPPVITRAASLTSRYANLNHQHVNHGVRSNSNFDLESPSSVLVNANMRALVNKEKFSLLPPSYRFKLTQMLPGCDQSLISVGVEEHKILAPSHTALTNEFFTQAVQEWRERLSDGEFTRETQSRIVQEIAKERNKVEPWKEKFFEEYYGQKKVSNQRLRIRSQNLAAEAGHKMRDLGMEAQLAIFAHLRPELEENSSNESSDSEPLISEEDDDLPLQNLIPAPALPGTGEDRAAIPLAKKMTYAEKIAKHKLENSKVQDNKLPLTTEAPTEDSKVTGPVTSLVMRPSWSVTGFPRSVAQAPSSTVTSGNVMNSGAAILNVQKRDDKGGLTDHSYTSTLWKKIGDASKLSSGSSTIRKLTSTPFSPRTSATLVLFPNGHLVQSIAHLRPDHVTKRKVLQNEESLTQTISPDPGSDVSAKHKRSLAAMKPGVHVISTISGPSDTERVLSLRARPLTPELFVGGGAKSVGVISSVTRQSPLSLIDPLPCEPLRPEAPDQKRPTGSAPHSHHPPTDELQLLDDVIKDNKARVKMVSKQLPDAVCVSSHSSVVAAIYNRTSPTVTSSSATSVPLVTARAVAPTSCTMTHALLSTVTSLQSQPIARPANMRPISSPTLAHPPTNLRPTTPSTRSHMAPTNLRPIAPPTHSHQPIPNTSCPITPPTHSRPPMVPATPLPFTPPTYSHPPVVPALPSCSHPSLTPSNPRLIALPSHPPTAPANTPPFVPPTYSCPSMTPSNLPPILPPTTSRPSLPPTNSIFITSRTHATPTNLRLASPQNNLHPSMAPTNLPPGEHPTTSYQRISTMKSYLLDPFNPLLAVARTLTPSPRSQATLPSTPQLTPQTIPTLPHLQTRAMMPLLQTLPQVSIPPSHPSTVASTHPMMSASISTPIAVSHPSSSLPNTPAKEMGAVTSEKTIDATQKPSSVTTPVQSPVASPRPLMAGSKRPFSASPSPLSTSPARWTSSSSSPSPLKKARTLAEIKAQMKAKRAAAGGRPMPQHPVVVSQQPAVVANTSSHLFSATTFPVYFPNVSEPNLKISINHIGNPLSPPSASYITLPSTGTLPLEKVQWVSHQGVVGPGIQGTTNPPPKPVDGPPLAKVPSVVSEQKPPVTSSSPPVTCVPNKPKRGKITLKIKTAGAAISLKVDADVIQKEMTRTVHTPSSDEDEDSSDGSNSDDSDPPKLFKHHRGPIRLPKLAEDFTDSDSDLDGRSRRRWSTTEDLDTGQSGRKVRARAPSVPRTTSVPTPLIPSKSQPVFGVPPFSVSVTAGSNIMTSPGSNIIKGSLFQTNSLFANVSAPNAWSSRKVSPGKPPQERNPPTSSTTFQNKAGRVFRSNSKGKDMENMQKLARNNLFHSDDSADSSDDDDRADSTFSTTTASDKCSDSDDDVIPTSVRRQSKVTSLDCKRRTRASVLADESKPNSLDELTSSNPTMKTT